MILDESFTLDQLRAHIGTTLGGASWRLEGMSKTQSDTIDQAISAALMAYSRRCPRPLYELIPLVQNQTVYTLQTKVVYNVYRCDFIFRSLTISPFMTSLVGVTPIAGAGGGVMGMEGRDFMAFLTWRKTFQRATSTEPKWIWDDEAKQLRISCPVAGGYIGVFIYAPRSFEQVRLIHKDFIRRFSIAHAKGILGRARSKFNGNIPGPGGESITLDGAALLAESTAEVKDLTEELQKFQTKAIPTFD